MVEELYNLEMNNSLLQSQLLSNMLRHYLLVSTHSLKKREMVRKPVKFFVVCVCSLCWRLRVFTQLTNINIAIT